jgi:hypothetical protein
MRELFAGAHKQYQDPPSHSNTPGKEIVHHRWPPLMLHQEEQGNNPKEQEKIYSSWTRKDKLLQIYVTG